METMRLDGIKHEHPTREDLETIHGHLLVKHARLVADIAFVETVLYPQADPDQAQFDFEAQAETGF